MISMTNIIDLQALTLAGFTVTRLVPDPLAVLSLDNRLLMNDLLVRLPTYDLDLQIRK